MLLKSLQLNLKNLRNISHLICVESSLIISCRKYGRYAPRKIAEIVNEDELFDIEENTTPLLPKEKKKSKFRSKTHKADEVQIEKEINFEVPNNKHEKPQNTISTKLYENEKLMSSIMMSIQTKRQRKKKNCIILEGKRLIQDAMKVGLVPEKIIFSRSQDLNDIPISETGTKLLKMPYRTIQLWSTLTTSPGILGIFEKPKPLEISHSALPITIICDNIRDPRNMGSILRAAAGVGCEKVILTKGCVDFWDSKVIRCGTGAHFRIPVYGEQEWDEIKSMIGTDAHIFFADNNANSNESNEEIENNVVNNKLKNWDKRKKYDVIKKLNNFNVVPYYDPDYTKNEVILIIGGETEGLSLESLELMESRKGIRVNIPLANNIDSLNAGMALGILVFEIKRQFSNKLSWKSN